ncbi:MAG TPA: HAMP domain-containing sensor histidine kinase [Thermoanaerobaculia bacterium]|nr:HAMP domain-containing sensor histidine kinase [Thermoanaerobaculia bacterium]
MTTHASIVEQLTTLASYLALRRDALIEAWEKAVGDDPELKTASSLSITHFRDLMPEVLKSFEDRLSSTGFDESALESEEQERVIEHGVHRWKQGYSLHELVREWHHLQVCVLEELERYGVAHPGVEPDTMAAARRLWTEVCGQGVAESVAEYARLQQAEAAGHLCDLKEALERLKELDRRRAESWREAAHDLRGNVGLVTTTTSILADQKAPEPLRTKAFSILQSSVSSLHQLLEDLMSLARLEAGREQRVVEPFDAAVLFRTLGEALQPLAHQRGLYLKVEGPETFPVEGDAAKVQRIVQNLALNALRYTEKGGVRLTWAETRENDVDRWLIRIEDTGPGLHFAPGVPIARDLRHATDLARKVEEEAPPGSPVEPIAGSSSAPPLPPVPAADRPPGEGIGLSIVKRLCELLEAGLELSSEAGKGTTFQVSLPRSYPNS